MRNCKDAIVCVLAIVVIAIGLEGSHIRKGRESRPTLYARAFGDVCYSSYRIVSFTISEGVSWFVS